MLLPIFADPRVGETMGGVSDRERVEREAAGIDSHWEEHGFGYWLWNATQRMPGARGCTRLGGVTAPDKTRALGPSRARASGSTVVDAPSMVVPPASRTSGAAASPKCSTPSATPFASTVVMRPAPTR